ncbi:hypothetical protein LEN26_020816 [Aphanomyces euteiches]|nr:hypothetical protein LEN26_020816 [Aphanomyces euteiches]KAH9109839.1 hypothetical protein AeMF1_015193 [Aphanomyces euteiches]
MGNEQSSPTVEPHEAQGGSHFGFRVLGIQENSPASVVGFVSFFDFILSANGIRLDTKDSTFMELIARSEDKAMQLSVYNVKSQQTRDLFLTPSRKWPGKGMLGVTIRFDSFEGADDHLLHVLEVAKKSPADVASLEPEADYLLGTPERVFRDPEDLYDEIVDHLDQPFQCYVYNAKTDQVRIVRITPHDRWGGEGFGYLGAEVGHGYLHRLPTSVRNSPGISVGFVSIAADAKAATDAYASATVPVAAPPTEPAEVPTEEESAEPAVATSPPTTEPVETVPVVLTALTPEDPTPPPPPAAPLSQSRLKPGPTLASPFPPVGFAGFPLSTVETYIDPKSPK